VKRDSQKTGGGNSLRDDLPPLLDTMLIYLEDLGALLLLAVAVLSALGLAGMTRGVLIDRVTQLLWSWMGYGAVALPLLLVLSAILVYRRRVGYGMQIDWWRIIFFELGFVGLLAFLSVLDGLSLPRAEAGMGGGLIGWGIGTLLAETLGLWATGALLLTSTLMGLGYALYPLARRGMAWIETRQPFELESDEPAPIGRRVGVPAAVEDDRVWRRSQKLPRRVPRKYRKNFRLPEQVNNQAPQGVNRDARLPPLDLLAGGETSRVTEKEINIAAGLIEKTLDDFGLPVEVVGFRTGPTVTQFAVEPGYIGGGEQADGARRSKVRVSQISALAKDLALALAASRLRIEAPVPGRPYVGIEVPNRKAGLVRLRPVLESNAFQSVESPLAIGLGRDVAGEAVAADLVAMPHLLIAGTTGSGKSVCITALSTCLIMNNTPQDLRLVMIDPKMVELIRFNGLPHLYGRVETELERIVTVLRWCTVEMDRRYRLFEAVGAREIESYNRKARRRGAEGPLPRIVVMIDELADLMMMAPDQTERVLVRLAQMARAVGIHLVVATQRPSTEILTGLIKANFPARIAFAVASGVDSRVVLDKPGAESLLGRGDMLFMSPDAAAPVRLQGVFVDDSEVERLVEYWQEMEARPAGEREEGQEPPWEDLVLKHEVLDERDEILERAIQLVRETGEASASMLQRKLRVGFPRAARLMDELQELGVIGAPQAGGRSREVLIEPDQDLLEIIDEDELED
jgi:S-DNA-T family DNA segregation ATPase FtsK/SpoIIIE